MLLPVRCDELRFLLLRFADSGSHRRFAELDMVQGRLVEYGHNRTVKAVLSVSDLGRVET
jgi:hypothetical protein